MATAAFVPWVDSSLTNQEEAAGQKKLVNIIVLFFLRENIPACVLNNILRGGTIDWNYSLTQKDS